VDILQVVEQTRSAVPGHLGRTLHHVVSAKSRYRDTSQVVHRQTLREPGELVADRVETLLRVLDQIHLVHAHHDVVYAKQRSDGRVPSGLLGCADPGVHQQQN
jgi:hypothetical protein